MIAQIALLAGIVALLAALGFIVLVAVASSGPEILLYPLITVAILWWHKHRR